MNKILKHFKIAVILFLILLSIFYPVVSAIDAMEMDMNFFKTSPLSTNDQIHSIMSIDHNGFAFIGEKNVNSNAHGLDFWLATFNTNGTILWENNYGGEANEIGKDFVKTKDGYFLVGDIYLTENESSDITLIKANSDGIYEWYKLFPGPKVEKANAIAKTSDGLIIAGFSNSFGEEDDFLIINVDENGDKNWIKNYGESGNQQAVDILQTHDGGYAAVGNNKDDFYLIKTDEKGTLIWEKRYGGKHTETASSLIQTTDYGFLLIGDTESYGMGATDIWIVKTDANGNEEWNRTYGGKDIDSGKQVFEINNSFLITGYGAHDLSFDSIIIKTDTNGYKLWEKFIRYPANEYATGFIEVESSMVSVGVSLLEKTRNVFLAKTQPITSNLTTNRYPVAYAGNDITTTPDSTLTFHTNGEDSDGTIVSYEWDFDGDGWYDEITTTKKTINHQYSEKGEYRAVLKITDNNGTTDVDMRKITIGTVPTQCLPNETMVIIGLIITILISLLFLYYDSKHHFRKKLASSKLKPLKFLSQLNIWSWYLFIAIIITIFLKSILSFLIQAPIVFFDAHSYGIIAHQIATGKLSIFSITGFIPSEAYITHPYPIGYPLMISPAYILTNNMELTYRFILFFNVLLSTLAMIPVYLIMKRFVNQKTSMIAAVIITWLPQMLTHNYLVMSETAFIFLFLLSCYLVLLVFEYTTFDYKFMFLGLFTGAVIVFTILIKAIGVALLPALIGVIIFNLLIKRKLNEFKHLIILIPFLPALFYLFFMGEQQPLGYNINGYLETLFSVFSNEVSFNQFFTVVLNEIYYLVLMSYLLFAGFSIFLIIFFKKFNKKEKPSLSLFIVYSMLSTAFLVIITADHIYRGQYTLYSRYVLSAIPVIFMLGIIGAHHYINLMKNKIRNPTYVLSAIFLVLGIFLTFIIPKEPLKILNNYDLTWAISSVSNAVLNPVAIRFMILIALFFPIIFYLLTTKDRQKIQNKKSKSQKQLKKTVIRKSVFKPLCPLLLFALLISITLTVPCLNHQINESNTVKEFKKPSLWFHQNDPDSHILVDDFNNAYLGGGMTGRTWWFYYASLYFWSPQSTFEYINPDELRTILDTNETNANYLLSTHELSAYYQKIEDIKLNIDQLDLPHQDYIDFHIYKIQ